MLCPNDMNQTYKEQLLFTNKLAIQQIIKSTLFLEFLPVKSTSKRFSMCTGYAPSSPNTVIQVQIFKGFLQFNNFIFQFFFFSFSSLSWFQSIYIRTVSSQCLLSSLQNWLKLVYGQFCQSNMHSIIRFLSKTKGQLILKCPFGVFKSPKTPTKFFLGFLPLPLKRGQIKINKVTFYH